MSCTAGSFSTRPGAAASGRLLGAVLLLPLVLAAMLVTAPAASAHGRSSDATNFRSSIRETPDIPGVRWRVYGGDEFLSVTNTTDTEIVILGYEGEPYLRVGPDGVFENELSGATYINDDRLGTQVPPGVTVDPTAPPQWRRVSGADQALWHDHRIHWMAPEPPRQAQGATEPVQVYERWSVPLQYGGSAYEVTGELVWVPGPSPVPWLALGLVLTAPALIGLRHRPLRDHWQAAARPAAVVLGVVALANVTHLVDDLFAVPLPWGSVALAAVQTALFVGMGILGAVKGWQAREGAFTALGVGSASILIGQGLLYLSTLTASQTTSILPETWSRVLVGASIAQAIPVGLVAVLGSRALLPEVQEPPSVDGSEPAPSGSAAG